MEKENLSFSSAVEFIARNHNIPVKYISEERSEEQMSEARHHVSFFSLYLHLRRYGDALSHLNF